MLPEMFPQMEIGQFSLPRPVSATGARVFLACSGRELDGRGVSQDSSPVPPKNRHILLWTVFAQGEEFSEVTISLSHASQFISFSIGQR